MRGRHGGGGMSQKRVGLGACIAQVEKGLTIGQRHCLFVGVHMRNQDCGGSNTYDEEFPVEWFCFWNKVEGWRSRDDG